MTAIAGYLARKFLQRVDRIKTKNQQEFAVYVGDLIGYEIAVTGGFETSEIKLLRDHIFSNIDPKTTCLDIGANIGTHGVAFSDNFSKVFCFEPHPRTQLLLCANMFGANAQIFDFGLSNENTTINAMSVVGNMGNSRIIPDGESGDISFEVRKLDDVAKEVDFGEISFIKIDVEGHEDQAFQGAVETIKKHSPIIAMEVNSTKNPSGPNEAMSFLNALGYDYMYTIGGDAFWEKLPSRVLQNLARTFCKIFMPAALLPNKLERVDLATFGHSPLMIMSKKELFPDMP